MPHYPYEDKTKMVTIYFITEVQDMCLDDIKVRKELVFRLHIQKERKAHINK